MITTYSADFDGDTAALIRHLAEAHEVVGIESADAVARHDHEHQVLDPTYVSDRWIDQHGHSGVLVEGRDSGVAQQVRHGRGPYRNS